MSEISLIDARSTSLTVTWPETPGCSQYKLEYRKDSEDEFTVLSESLKSSQARKKNLSAEQAYFFRVTPILNSGRNPSITHSEPFRTISSDAETSSMEAPQTAQRDFNQSLVITWQKVDKASGYELQMRENTGGTPWKTIAPSLSGLEVKKKNLTSSSGYQFRVRPVISDESTKIPFSPPSEAAVAQSLSPGIQRWFHALDNGTLIRKGVNKPIPLAEALGGKEFVLLYASAHWCGPCRQFTPMLSNWYDKCKSYAEVVFLSADHDASGFRSYFQSSHPWLAVDYDDDARENIMGTIRVSSIPRLVVLSGRTGKIIEDNAVGKQLDIAAWRNHPNHKL